MSEVLNIGSGIATIYGTFAGATAYFDTSDSAAAVAWKALATDDDRKKKLADATRFLNRLGYVTDYQTFAARDALDLGTDDADAAFPFRAACYELAGLAADDRDVLTADDQGSNVRAVGAGSARVEFFSPTSAQRGTASVLPSTVEALIGPYLAASADALDQDGGSGSGAGCENPFGHCRDYDRRDPW
jgi:hypothetical protein